MNDAFKNIGYITVDEINRAFNTECGPDCPVCKPFDPLTNSYSIEINNVGSAMSAREMFMNLMRGTSQRGKINNEDTNNKEEVNPMKDTRIEALERQVESLALRIQKLARWGDDTYKDGTVLIVDKVFKVEEFEAGDETVPAYRYALVKIGAYWYMTGQNSGRYTWAQVVDFFNDGRVINIEKVTKTKAILTDVTE